jgi:hypothetical protein
MSNVTKWLDEQKQRYQQAMAGLRGITPGERMSAAAALGELGCFGWDSVASLARLLADDPDERVRASLASSLAELGSDLLEAARQAMIRRKVPSAVLTLDNDPHELIAVVRTEILPALTRAIQSKNIATSDAALAALSSIALTGAVGFEELPEIVTAISASIRIATGAEGRPTPAVFSTFCPKQALFEAPSPLYVYAHTIDSVFEVRRDVEALKHEMRFSGPHATGVLPRLAAGTPITVVPEGTDLEFDPPALTLKWNAPWLRFAFAFTPKDTGAVSRSSIRVSISVADIEVASITCPLTAWSFLSSHEITRASTVPYQKIFVSYSHKDLDVVSAYRLAQDALGNDLFIDTYSLRSGDDWRSALRKGMDEAEIMQLFWSENSARSRYVREEWEYAMEFRCPSTRCAGFVRPVYWTNPMPVPPEQLRHLHFRFVALTRTS